MTQGESSDDVDFEDVPTVLAQAPAAPSEEPGDEGSQSGLAPRTRSNRPLSSFGPPRSSSPPALEIDHSLPQRPSLYERLLESGALDEVMEAAAQEKSEDSLNGELPVGGLQPARLPDERMPDERMPDESALMDASEDFADPPVMPRLEIADDIAEESAREQQEDAVAEEDILERTPAPRRLVASTIPPPLPRNTPAPDLPSVLLGPGASSRHDATERIVLEEITEKVLTHSLTPRSAAPSRAPEESRGGWIAVLLVLVTAGAIAVWVVLRSGESRAPGVTEATAAAPEQPLVEVPVVEQVVEVDDAPPPLQLDEQASAAADEPGAEAAQAELAVEPSPGPDGAPVAETPAEARERRRARRAARLAREAAAAEAEPVPVAEQIPAAPEPAQAEPVAAEPVAPVPPTLTPAARDLQEAPNREQVVAIMKGLHPAFQKCLSGKHGVARLTLTVRGVGQVSHTLVGGDFAGTPEGSCIARAVKGARFPPFSRARVKIEYPVQL